jgi:hypothetical protein
MGYLVLELNKSIEGYEGDTIGDFTTFGDWWGYYPSKESLEREISESMIGEFGNMPEHFAIIEIESPGVIAEAVQKIVQEYKLVPYGD